MICLPIFQLSSLVSLLEKRGFGCRIGLMELDIHPMKRPYFERWLLQRDGFLKMSTGNIDYIGIEEVVRIGPFFNVYFVVENDFIAGNDENAHNLFDAWPYFQLQRGKVTAMGWSGGILADILTKDMEVLKEFSDNVMNEEIRKMSIQVSDYCCIIETRAWDPAGVTSVFGLADRIAMNMRKLIKQVHLGEDISR